MRFHNSVATVGENSLAHAVNHNRDMVHHVTGEVQSPATTAPRSTVKVAFGSYKDPAIATRTQGSPGVPQVVHLQSITTSSRTAGTMEGPRISIISDVGTQNESLNHSSRGPSESRAICTSI